MIFETSNDGILSCSPRLLNMSVKFCGVSAMRPSCRSERELQPLLQRMQGQTGKTANHCTIETDILQVAAYGQLDAADQHVDIPPFHLIGDEATHATLLTLHEIGKDAYHAAIDLAADGRIARELAADFDQHGLELVAHLAVAGSRITL